MNWHSHQYFDHLVSKFEPELLLDRSDPVPSIGIGDLGSRARTKTDPLDPTISPLGSGSCPGSPVSGWNSFYLEEFENDTTGSQTQEYDRWLSVMDLGLYPNGVLFGFD